MTDKVVSERQWEANLKYMLSEPDYLALPAQEGLSEQTGETCTVPIDRVEEHNALLDRAV